MDGPNVRVLALFKGSTGTVLSIISIIVLQFCHILQYHIDKVIESQ